MSPRPAGDRERAAVGREREGLHDPRAEPAGLATDPILAKLPARGRVEGRDDAWRVSDRQHAPVVADCRRVELRVGGTAQEPDRRVRGTQQRGEQVAARPGRILERDPRPREQQRAVDLVVRERLRSKALRVGGQRRVAGGISLVQREEAGHDRGDERRGGSDEQDPQPAVAPACRLELAELVVAARTQELSLQLVELAVVRACPVAGAGEACAAVEQRRVASGRPPSPAPPP